MFTEICEKLIKTAALRKKEKEQTKLNKKEESKKCCKWDTYCWYLMILLNENIDDIII